MSKKSYVAENGITLGLAGLALLVIFAIALPKWVHNDDTRAISLPGTLSGGYSLLTESSHLEGLPDGAAGQISQSLTKVDTNLGDVANAKSRTALYVDQKLNQVAVQVVRAGGASPMLVPLTVEGTYSTVGLDTCFAQTSSQTGQQGPTTCRRSSDGLTIQLAMVGTDRDAAAHLDELWSKVS